MASTDPVPVVPLSADGKVWPISGAPVDLLTLPANRYLARVERPSPDVLEFAPTAFARLVGLLMMAASGAILYVGIFLMATDRVGLEWSWQSPIGVLFWLAVVIVLACHGLNELTSRTTFDRGTKQWQRRSAFGINLSVSLDHLLAVQCLYVCHRTLKGFSFDVYELNLVWKLPELERKTVQGESNAERVRALGAEMAEFLRVPLVDQIDATQAHYRRNRRWWN